ncbi:MAG: ATP-binding protein [bacterium]
MRSNWGSSRRPDLLTETLIAGAALVLLVAQHFNVRARLREQGRIQGELRASEAKFSGILEIAADAIITVDQAQRIVHFNRGAEEIFGYTAPDAIGRHLAILLPARFRASHDAHLERFAQSATTARRMGERRAIFGLRSDGTEFPAEASISKLVAPDGILFTVVLRDITNQKRAEEDERFLSGASTDLAQTLAVEATLRAIVDLPIPRLADACLLDLVGANDQFRRITSLRQRAELTPALAGLEANTLTYDSPSPIIDAIRRNRREAVDTVDEDWLEGSADPETIPHWRSIGPMSLLILPLHAAGETFGALTLIRTQPSAFDAERRTLADKYATSAATSLANARLYDAARKANRAREEVLSIVSHDLRNPLSAIAMCARVLEENPPGDERTQKELLVTIRESTEWMNRLIDDLLDAASIERGRLSLQLTPQEPSQLALQALHMFETEASEQGLALDARLPTNLPLVRADGARIVQVLGNLMRNAIKFTPAGGRVVIGIEHRGDALEFTVRDTGVGISAESQSRVFDRYWQSSDGVRARGSGLGLSIAKGIVEAHAGRIWVESVPGQGSTFAFTIPQAGRATIE